MKYTRTFSNQTFFWILIGLIGMLGLAYVYFVSSSIFNVVLRKEIERDIARTHVELSELEMQYLTLKDHINESLAFSLGFHSTDEKHYVERRALSRNTEINTE